MTARSLSRACSHGGGPENETLCTGMTGSSDDRTLIGIARSDKQLGTRGTALSPGPAGRLVRQPGLSA